MESNRGTNLAVLVFGLGLVALGVLFLLGQIFRFNVWSVLWPFLIIVPGLLFFVAMVLVGRTGAALAIPGAIVTMVGMLLLYQAATGHWESWAYAWALVFPTSVGAGIAISGLWAGDPRAIRAGAGMAAVGVGLFMAFGALFEVVFNISGLRSGPFGRIVLPTAVTGAGVALMAWALYSRRRER